MIKIYHNPRCKKSREGVAFLEEAKVEFEIVKYLEDNFTLETLTETLQKLNITPDQLIRKTEAIWKSEYKGKQLSDQDLIQAMIQHPKLIERPIVVNQNKAVVARPTDALQEIL